MTLHHIKDPRLFLQEVEDYLLKDEVTHALPLGLLKNLVKSEVHTEDGSPFLAYYKKEKEDVPLILIRTPPHHLIVSGEIKRELHLDIIVDELLSLNSDIPSIIGVPQLVEPFAALIAKKTSRSIEVDMNQRIYRLDQVIPPKITQGDFRPAEERDRSTLAEWIFAFAKEALDEGQTKEWALERAERGIREHSLFVWERGGQIVTMAGTSRPTETGITITLVYTPPEERKQGLASQCVAALCQHLLDRGYQFCSLYTDLANSTSNKIYQKIGFYPVSDSIVIRFK